MAASVYEISATNITETTATIVLQAVRATTASTRSLEVQDVATLTTVVDTTFVDPGMATGDTVSVPISGLTKGTTYLVTVGDDVDSFTTLDNTPKTATADQWQDLADRIKGLPTPLVVSLVSPITTTQSVGQSTVQEIRDAYTNGQPIVIDAKASRLVPGGQGTDTAGYGMFLVEKIAYQGAGSNTYKLYLSAIDAATLRYEVTLSDDSYTNNWSCMTQYLFVGSYSTAEMYTCTVWIDNKRIYKKTITYSIASTGNNTAAHGIIDLGHVVKLEGALVSSSGDSKDLNYNDMNNAAVTYSNSSSVVTYAVGSDVVGRTAYVTIYYTKSS